MKNFKLLLLAVLVVCTVCVLTVFAGATETVVDVANGYVMMYQSDKTTAIADADRTDTELTWKVQDITVGDVTERVLTIEGEDTSLTFNSAANWNALSTATIPWWSYASSITKVVIEAPIKNINQDYAFKSLTKVHTFVLPDTVIGNNGKSCSFASLRSLTTFGPEGTPEGTIDLRNIYNLGYGAFEDSCKGQTVTILTPYVKNAFASNYKLFTTTTTATIKTIPGTASDVYFRETYPAWTPSKTEEKLLTADNYTVEAYTEAPVSGVSTDGFAKWDFDAVSGLLSISKTDKTGWAQFNPSGAYMTFKNEYGNYVKNIVFNNGFNKLYCGDSNYFFAGMVNLETVKFTSGQRIQNNSNKGLFEGCTALNAIAFGKDPVAGVADFENVSITGKDGNGVEQDSAHIWLSKIFSGCEAIKKVILPTSNNLTIVHADTFAGCIALEEVVVGANITTINEGAFDAWTASTEGYSALTVTFTEMDSTVGLALKETEGGLLTVDAPKTELVTGGQVDQTEGNENDLVWNYDGNTKTLTISGTSTSIVWKDGATSGWNGTLNNTDVSMIPWMADYASEIEKIIIEAPITTTPAAMFYKNHALKSVTFPVETVSLGGMAFADCKALVELKTAGVDSPDNVIDLRNFTGTVSHQVFETAPANGATLWLPRTGSFNLNNVFGRTGYSYNFVVYPGSVGETSVYNMINAPASRVYGTFDYTYYTAEQQSEWYTEYMETTSYDQGTSGTATYAVTYNFDMETGKVTIVNDNWERTLGTNEWNTMITTWKYAIKTIHIKDSKKITATNTSGTAVGELVDLPELQAIIADFTRVQGSLRVANNSKLEAFGSSSKITKGVLDLSNLLEINNTGKTIYAYMFAGHPLFTKLVLPKPDKTNPITTIKANAFSNCTGLTSIVVPAGCAITTVEDGAFAGLENAVTIYNEAADDVAAQALLAVLPTGSKIYTGASSEGEDLERVIVFDGWKVRTSGYNGLRGVFYADQAKIDANEDTNGWTLQEYGALLSTTAKKDSIGAKVYYDAATNTVTADAHLRTYPIYSTNESVDIAKVLTGADVENEANTYFAVTVTKYNSNYTTEVYMAGYEVWTKDGEVVILYTDYATDTAHDSRLQDASIYEVSMRMYMDGFMNDETDTNDIVWNVLVNGGAVTLTKDEDYVVTNDKLTGEMKDMNGDAFGDKFALVKIPQVEVVVTNGDVTGFKNSETALTVFNSPYNSGKYVLVHSSIGGTTSAKTAASWGNGTSAQFMTNWFSGSKVTSISATNFPNPIIKTNIWGNIEHVVIDTGIEALDHMAYRECGATTYVYSADLTSFKAQAFESTYAIKTMYRAGYPVSEGTVDLHWLSSVYSTYTFDASNGVVEYWLPANAKVSTEFFKANANLTTVWFGGGYDENGNPENRVAGVIDFTNATAMKTIDNKLFSTKGGITTIRLHDEFTAIGKNAFSTAIYDTDGKTIIGYGKVEGITVQQGVFVQAIYDVCQELGLVYTDLTGAAYEPVETESLEGWSGIIVK